MRKLALVALLASSWAATAHAGTIVTDNSGAGTETVYVGQSFTTTGAVFDNIGFSFYDPSGNRQALGTAYLFSSAYTGTPDGLAAASANLIGTAVGAGGVYSFDPSVQLAASTQYYLYSDTQMNVLGGGTYYNGGNYSITSDASDGFAAGADGHATDDVNFILEGSFADFTVPADLPVVDSALAGTVTGPAAYYGQSFITGDTAIDHVTFNFFGADGSPLAPGSAYLFSSRYDGFVRDIQTATEDLVGKALMSGSLYVFDPSMTLAPNTLYYLYSDGLARIVGGNNFVTPDTQAFIADNLANYSPASGAQSAQDANYILRGAAISAVPEPAAWAMMLAGFGLVGGMMRSSRRKESAPLAA